MRAPTHLVQLLRGMEEHPEKARFDELLSAAGIPHPAGIRGRDPGRAACGSSGERWTAWPGDGRDGGHAGRANGRCGPGERGERSVRRTGAAGSNPGCPGGLSRSPGSRGRSGGGDLPPFRSAGSDPGRGAVPGSDRRDPGAIPGPGRNAVRPRGGSALNPGLQHQTAYRRRCASGPGGGLSLLDSNLPKWRFAEGESWRGM